MIIIFFCLFGFFYLKLKEKVLQRQQGSYILTVEAGRQLLLSADNQAEVALQTELTEIQEQWKHASVCLDDQKKELSTLLKVKKKKRQQEAQTDLIFGFDSKQH